MDNFYLETNEDFDEDLVICEICGKTFTTTDETQDICDSCLN